MIGSSRFKPLKKMDSAIEIGWSFLSRSYWGKDYNKAAKSLMIDHALRYYSDVVFYVGKDNIRSQKAMEKLGSTIITKNDKPHILSAIASDFTYHLNNQKWIIYKAQYNE